VDTVVSVFKADAADQSQNVILLNRDFYVNVGAKPGYVAFQYPHPLQGGAAITSDYYVAKTGSDSNTCVQARSTSTPKLTITAGIGCLSSGNKLLVRAGTYAEHLFDIIPSGASSAAMTRIAAYPGETVWLTPSSGNWAIHFGNDDTPGAPAINTQYIEIDGININGVNLDGSAVVLDDRGTGGITQHVRFQNLEVHGRDSVADGGSANILVAGHDNEFINLTVHGIGGPYGFYVHGTSNIIDGCDIYATSAAGIQIYYGAAGPYIAPTANIVRNTRIHDITTSNFFAMPSTNHWGILVSGDNNQIYNNVIDHNVYTYTQSNGGIYVYTGSGSRIYNNTIANNSFDGIRIAAGVSGTYVVNNISYQNHALTDFVDGGSTTNPANNLLGVNPLFVNAGTGDYRVNAGSPAIDSGIANIYATTDKNGVTRPQGGAYDRGAYER